MEDVTCSSVSKQFGGVAALKTLSLRFAGPDLVALIGPNGAGKTTLFNILCGYLRPDAGVVSINGIDITGLSPHVIAHLGMSRTFQEVRVARAMSALDNVKVGLEPLNWSAATKALRLRFGTPELDERCHELLARVNLGAYWDHTAGNLSYGQQKLLSIACGLASGGGIILLDEPFASLDPSTTAVISRLLDELVGECKLVLFIEHNIEIVRRIARRTVVLAAGEVIADGPAAEILSQRDIYQRFLV